MKELLKVIQSCRFLKCMPNRIVVIDKKYKIIFINHTEDDHHKDEIIGKSTMTFHRKDEQTRIKLIYDEVFKTGKPIQIETQVIMQEHNYCTWYEFAISPLTEKDEPIQYLIISSLDISKRKTLEEVNLKLSKEINELLKEKDQTIKTQAIATSKKNLALTKFLKKTVIHEFLTKREQEIHGLVKAGFLSKEIAHKLNISTKTVSNHRDNINKKLAQLNLEKDI